MVDTGVLHAWVRQARTDHDAATSLTNELPECHRRYLLQQACEKGIKALGLILWDERSADAPSFNQFFLHRHDPLKRLGEQHGLPRSLRALFRQVHTELGSIDNAKLLRQVDATTPSTDPTDISYRYPFVSTQSGQTIAPADLQRDDWDAYQGNEMGVAGAIRRLLDRVEARARRARAL